MLTKGKGREGEEERGREGDEMWRGKLVSQLKEMSWVSPFTHTHTHLLTMSMEPFLSFRKSLEQHTSLTCG